MPNVIGVVEAKRRDGAGVLLDDGNWYGIYPDRKDELSGVEKGSCVTIAYTQKAQYKNIKTVALMDPEEAVTSGAQPAPFNTPVVKRSGAIARSFPVDPLSPERSIIRQNAMARAVEILEAKGIKSTTDDELEAKLEHWARFVESYTSGDMDARRAEAKMKAMAPEADEDDSE